MTFGIPASIKGFIKDLLTGIDGQSYDIGRVMWALGVLFYLGETAYSVHAAVGHPFDYVQFGTGFGLIMGASAGALKWKESTEPPASSNQSGQ